MAPALRRGPSWPPPARAGPLDCESFSSAHPTGSVNTGVRRAVLNGMKRATRIACLALLAAALSGSGRKSPFRQAQILAPGKNREPAALGAGDFDGDGRLDLAVGCGGSDDVVIFVGDGRGGFRRGGSFPAGPSPTEIAVADFY